MPPAADVFFTAGAQAARDAAFAMDTPRPALRPPADATATPPLSCGPQARSRSSGSSAPRRGAVGLHRQRHGQAGAGRNQIQALPWKSTVLDRAPRAGRCRRSPRGARLRSSAPAPAPAPLRRPHDRRGQGDRQRPHRKASLLFAASEPWWRPGAPARATRQGKRCSRHAGHRQGSASAPGRDRREASAGGGRSGGHHAVAMGPVWRSLRAGAAPGGARRRWGSIGLALIVLPVVALSRALAVAAWFVAVALGDAGGLRRGGRRSWGAAGAAAGARRHLDLSPPAPIVAPEPPRAAGAGRRSRRCQCSPRRSTRSCCSASARGTASGGSPAHRPRA